MILSSSECPLESVEGTFLGKDGLTLCYQCWQPLERSRANVLLVHGLGAHCRIFNNLVHPLIARNFAVYSFDLRGHGKSPGQRGFIRSWGYFREDLASFFRFIESDRAPAPCFLVGHSLGSIIALDYALNSPEKLPGLVLLSPPLGAVGAPPLRVFVGRILSRVWPRFSLSTGFDWSALSRDRAAVTAAMADPLRHPYATARLVTEYFETLEEIKQRAPSLQLPLLILQGGSDRIALPEGSRQFFARLTCPDKELREYAEARHEMQEDLNAAEVAADLADWLECHLP